mmetsp:Transcript_34761/g.91019  ORF Transcript_34761/g.91019 Transcript_34761/m.91019 type:complete len:260 (-) Transcript_34761:7-786(-)
MPTTFLTSSAERWVPSCVMMKTSSSVAMAGWPLSSLVSLATVANISFSTRRSSFRKMSISRTIDFHSSGSISPSAFVSYLFAISMTCTSVGLRPRARRPSPSCPTGRFSFWSRRISYASRASASVQKASPRHSAINSSGVIVESWLVSSFNHTSRIVTLPSPSWSTNRCFITSAPMMASSSAHSSCSNSAWISSLSRAALIPARACLLAILPSFALKSSPNFSRATRRSSCVSALRPSMLLLLETAEQVTSLQAPPSTP